MIEKTILEWTYQLRTYFEAPYSCSTSESAITVSDGKVTATLIAPQDPVDAALLRAVRDQVEIIFACRHMQVEIPVYFAGPTVCQHHANGHKETLVLAQSHLRLSAKGEMYLTRAWGGGIDTKAERIAEHARFLDLAVQKSQDQLLQSLLHSYGSAIYPPNELGHLYEIREALSKHFRGESSARKQLGILKSEWQRLGFLADAAPLKEGRHCGAHVGSLRDATKGELDEARRIARGWIEKYLLQLP